MPAPTSYFPHVLFAAYVVLFVALGVAPRDRAVWWAENIPIVLLAGALAVLYVRGVRLSNLGYAFASVLLFMHTVGGHYTFEHVPFGWVTRTFGFERNHYDRIYAAVEGGSAGAAFLGSQGDIWDAQKDMLADISGAMFATAVLAIRPHRTRRSSTLGGDLDD